AALAALGRLHRPDKHMVDRRHGSPPVFAPLHFSPPPAGEGRVGAGSYADVRRCHKSSAVAMVRVNLTERMMSDSGKTQRRRLGKNGPEVLPIGLGCMSLSGTYGPSDDKAAEALIRRAVELGVDHFDSSDMYGWGHNEELLGRALKGLHDHIVIATKFGQTRRP